MSNALSESENCGTLGDSIRLVELPGLPPQRLSEIVASADEMYRERISDARLQAVVETVRTWLQPAKALGEQSDVREWLQPAE